MEERKTKKEKTKSRAAAVSGKTKKEKSDFDVIVIGTGMGGCAAGAITALNGMKTLILEKNPRPGGNCSYYEKDGFHVDAGTHLFPRGNRGPFGVLTKRLGMGTPIDFRLAKNTTHLKGMNIDIIVPLSKFKILCNFVLPRLAWQSKINPRHYPGILRLFRDIAKMKDFEIERLNNVSVYDFMKKYTDNPDIRNMLAMYLGLCFILPPWEASAGESVWNLQKTFEGAALYPKGGAVAIPRTFLKGAQMHGADIRYNAEVKTIIIANGRASGVVLKNGEKITAKAVISTTGIKDTVLRLTGSRYYPGDYADRIKNLKSSWTAVQAKIGVKKQLVKAGLLVGGVPLKFKGGITDELIMKIMKQLENGELLDMLPIYAPIPTNYDPDLAPKGCQIITAVAVAPTLEVKQKVSHEVWLDAMMNALYQMIPGLKENIIFCDLWSVPTLAGWIGKANGSTITTAQTMDQVSFRRPPHELPVKGLYAAGDCAGPAHGIGTELACQSGMDCGDLVSSHIYNHVI